VAQTRHEQVLVMPPPWSVHVHVSIDDVTKHEQMSAASQAGSVAHE
jgi:hypothetical protein